MLPKFNFTHKLVNLLAHAQGLYGQIEAETEIPSLVLKLSQENQALATHHSTSIEGNPLTQKEVTNLLLGDKIAATKSEKEVKNYFEVLNRISVLAKQKTPLNIQLTLNLHQDLMKNLSTKGLGEFRNEPVVVGHRDMVGGVIIKHNPPAHKAEDIKQLLTQLYKNIEDDKENHPLIKAGLFHHGFSFIHPFFDGNGRMARILTAYYLLLNDYEVTKYFILDDYYDIDRSQYSDMLHSADVNNKTQWLEYFLEGITYSLQAALGRIKDLKKEGVDALSGSKRVLVSRREEEVLQLLIEKKAVKTQDIVEAFSVSRQQAQSLLHSLVKKEIIMKRGKTKLSYYELV